MLHFEWNSRKEAANKKKHKISFTEAKSVFYDDNARLILDEEHSNEEQRFILLGMSNLLNILLVIHCYQESEEKIRIISARKATKNEIAQYQEHLK